MGKGEADPRGQQREGPISVGSGSHRRQSSGPSSSAVERPPRAPITKNGVTRPEPLRLLNHQHNNL